MIALLPLRTADCGTVYSMISSAACKHDPRYVDAERLGGLQIEHELELLLLSHRKISGIFALKDMIDI